jgi:probable rRNA maturation factor
MKLNLEVNNKSKSSFSRSSINEVVKKTLNKVGFVFLRNKKISLSLAFVSEKEIKEINKKFRKINKTTDVLSFAEFEDSKSLKKEKSEEIFLGEIILCYNYIRDYAKKNKIKVKTELAEVISHGVLHLLGFKHGDEMFKIQKEVAKKS